MTTKPLGTVSKVNAAVVHGKILFLLGEICPARGTGLTVKPVWPHWNQEEPGILLDELDRELEKRGHRFVRYADDLLVLVKSERAGQRVKARGCRIHGSKRKD